jgi:phosphonopyruvate decarboxylase
MMNRDHCFAALAAVRGRAIVVGTYTSAFEWERIAPSPLNLPATGAMGQGSSHGLGLALGLPNEKIMVLDGDGALLMNLGTLVTIANAKPKNLIHFVVENGTYEANGGHPIPGQGTVDFAGMARAAGFPHVFEFDDIATFTAEIGKVVHLDGPVFVTLKVVPGDTAVTYDYVWMHSQATRDRFSNALAPLTAK